jgi:hypothetical protein
VLVAFGLIMAFPVIAIKAYKDALELKRSVGRTAKFIEAAQRLDELQGLDATVIPLMLPFSV